MGLFQELKPNVTIEELLKKYGVNLKPGASGLRGRCPIHQGNNDEDFNIDTVAQRFHCVSCGRHGNVVGFYAVMECCSIEQAAIKLNSWAPGNAGIHSQEKAISGHALALAPVEASNLPLGYQLEALDHHHPYLKHRGITSDTAQAFGVGYFLGKGMMSGRVVIPIHNGQGELVAYAGRAATNQTQPKYTFSSGFQKSAVLYNLHQIKPSSRKGLVHVVESFFGVMKLTQAGFPNAVALMGASMSETQVELLSRHFTHAILLLDEDDEGMEGMMDAVLRLSHFMYVATGCLPQHINTIAELSEEEIQHLLSADLIEERDRPRLVK